MISVLVEMKNSVWPSGGAAVRSRSAGMKMPPARFSTNTVVFRLSLIFCATRRAITSVAPPAASPTMMLDRLGGQVLRVARVARPASSAAHAMRSQAGAHRSPSFLPSVDRCYVSASSVAMMRSRVNGRSRMRVPSARATALPIAAAVGPIDDLAEAERGLVGRRR